MNTHSSTLIYTALDQAITEEVMVGIKERELRPSDTERKKSCVEEIGEEKRAT